MDRYLAFAILVGGALFIVVGVAVKQLNWAEWIQWVAFAVAAVIAGLISNRGVPKQPPGN